MEKSIALILAWPETHCKRAGGWYEPITHLLGFSINGYYRVGHAAIVLINGETGYCSYFDFGRYHTPHGNGRVRGEKTDHDLKIKTILKWEGNNPTNLSELTEELQNNKSCHGDGHLKVGVLPIDFYKSHDLAIKLQLRDFIPYGPFIRKGTNCSRFVRSIATSGSKNRLKSLKMHIPWMLSPTPMWNVEASFSIDKYLSLSKSKNVKYYYDEKYITT